MVVVLVMPAFVRYTARFPDNSHMNGGETAGILCRHAGILLTNDVTVPTLKQFK